MDLANLRRVAALSAAAVASIQATAAVVALRKGRRDYADVAWGPGLAGVAVTGALAGSGDARRRWALAAAVTAWAVRLEHQMLKRVRGSEKEDPRYTEFLDGDSTATVIGKVFVTQGVCQLLVSLPVQVAAASALPRSARRWLAPAGLAVMVGGAVVEALADRQKTEYSKKDDRPDVLDTGLWGWSRHPNYLGDSLVWDGAWLTAAASSPAGWTLPAPALMSYLLMFATGAKRTEQRMRDRPGYRDYQDRVAFFFPWPSPKST
ncbi:DUF1295 domain-containing protein [Lentzea sp. NPDC058436]|uniref:DUF1295 domain-containing protein n=1 Tax=Lentzea sp. NPDC058436 TaxID=3346499 RepID=UPI003646A6C1